MTSGRREWRNWPVVLGAALGLGTALPIWNYVSSLFVISLTDAFGWTRGELAAASAFSVVGALAAPLIGRIADRVGARPVLCVGLIAYAATFAAFALQPGTLAAYSTLIVVHTMVGLACGGAIFSRAVAGWFERGRGLALGLTMSGVPASAAVITPVLQWVIATHGWQAGYAFLGGIALCVGLPIVLLLVREPRDARSGEETPSLAAEAGDEAPPTERNGVGWPEMMRSSNFWLLLVSLIPVNAAGTGIMSQMAPLLTDRGLSGSEAATLLSIFAVSVIVSRLAAGWALDRFSPNAVAAVVTAAPAIGCAMLLWAPPGVAVSAIALMFVGVQQGAEIDLVGYLLARMFGILNYATAYGVCVLALGLSGAAGVAAFGIGFDIWGGYGVVLAISIPAFIIGAVLLVLIRIRQPHT